MNWLPGARTHSSSIPAGARAEPGKGNRDPWRCCDLLLVGLLTLGSGWGRRAEGNKLIEVSHSLTFSYTCSKSNPWQSRAADTRPPRLEKQFRGQRRKGRVQEAENREQVPAGWKAPGAEGSR